LRDGPGVLIRCEGSTELGLGHVVRCGALAAALQEQGSRVVFLCRERSVGSAHLEGLGFTVIGPEIRGERSYWEWIAEALNVTGARALVCDVRDKLSRGDLKRLKEERELLVCLIDDGHERRLAADLSFYPPVPQFADLRWEGAAGRAYSGWDWVILRRDFATIRRERKDSRDRILVMMGGTDPRGMTGLVFRELSGLGGDFEVHLVIGGGFAHRAKLASWQALIDQPVRVHDGVSDMASLMAEMDLAVIGFGMTAYELAAVGIPGIYLCLTQDHADSARLFHDAGLGRSLGIHSEVTDGALRDEIDGWLTGRAGKLKTPLPRTIDGKGAWRIATKMREQMKW
jgi:spore coat polysaccharide biosynthesis predicted glycosyltransferase SpsG